MGFNRLEIINFLVDKYSYQRYLEIGVRGGKVFKGVKCPYKVGVDPAPQVPVTHRVTSDYYFSNLVGKDNFDLIFIDGLHLAEQTIKDINNSLRHLNPGGALVVHDCNPAHESWQTTRPAAEKWNGTVWKAWAWFRMNRPDLDMRVVNKDHGCGIIRRGTQICFTPSVELNQMNWGFLDKNRSSLLNLISLDDFRENYP